jgi:hypothetical protein
MARIVERVHEVSLSVPNISPVTSNYSRLRRICLLIDSRIGFSEVDVEFVKFLDTTHAMYQVGNQTRVVFEVKHKGYFNQS